MRIIKLTELASNHKLIKEVLKSSGLIIFPTETCYGLGALATDEAAVDKLLKYKNRPAGKAISVAVGDKGKVSGYVEINETVRKVVENFMPGPITIVAKSLSKVDSRLENEEGGLGIRIPAFEPLLALLQDIGLPITSTSANLAGKPSPYSLVKLLEGLPEKKRAMIDLAIDAGDLPKNPPSIVIDSQSTNKVYREGLLSAEDLLHGEVFESNSPEETIQIAAGFAAKVLNALNVLNDSDYKAANFVIRLEGEMGAGKTQFAKGIAKGLGITKIIKSPTFNLVREYSFGTRGIFYHADLWRLASSAANLDAATNSAESDDDSIGGNNVGDVSSSSIGGANILASLGICRVEDAVDGKVAQMIAAVEWPGREGEFDYHASVKILKVGENLRRIVIREKLN